jgi:glycosyltransferase involved in cell wall biosynthesis
LLAPFADPAAFVDLAASLANEPMLARRLRARARKITESADWEIVLDDFEKGLFRILRQTNDATYFQIPDPP